MGLIFIGIFVFSAVFGLGAFLFGHDADHDVSHGVDHSGGIPSIFSTRVISLFLLGFSGMGIVAHYAWHFSLGYATLCGLGSGVIMGALAYGIIEIFFRQQATSMVSPADYVGLTARVTGSIPAGGTGEVSVTVRDQLRSVLAVSADGTAIPEGRAVVIVSDAAGTVTVKPA